MIPEVQVCPFNNEGTFRYSSTHVRTVDAEQTALTPHRTGIVGYPA